MTRSAQECDRMAARAREAETRSAAAEGAAEQRAAEVKELRYRNLYLARCVHHAHALV